MSGEEGSGSPVAKTFQFFSLVFVFFGPAQLVAVGYIDPGNWATDLAGGAQSGYAQLFTILMCNISAIVLQLLSMKLGAITGRDLAQQCRVTFGKYTNLFLWLSCELAIIATDLAEVIGSAVALYLLFNLPLTWGILLTGLDVFIVLLGLQHKLLYIEVLISVMVLLVFGGLGSIVIKSDPDYLGVFLGCLPINPNIVVNPTDLFTTIAIIGATIMPHNLYLHSALARDHFAEIVKNSLNPATAIFSSAPEREPLDDHLFIFDTECNNSSGDDQGALLHIFAAPPASADELLSMPLGSRCSPKTPPTDRKQLGHMEEMAANPAVSAFLSYSKIGLIISLILACVINGAILIVSGTQFRGMDPPPGLEEAFYLLSNMLGQGWAIIFAISLLLSGQSATITGTMAGSIVMEGFLDMQVQPWIRRLATRSFAIIPALGIAAFMGSAGLDRLLVLSQVILSFQLPFSVFPLVYFTDNDNLLGSYTNSNLLTVFCYALACTLTIGNAISIVGAFF